MKKIGLVLLLLPFLLSCGTDSEKPAKNDLAPVMTGIDSLRTKLKAIIDSAGIPTGIAVIHPGKNDTFSINGNQEFILMSVVKFPQSFAALSRVDKGELKLGQQLHYAPPGLRKTTYSPMLKTLTASEFDMSLEETIRYAVSESDNNASDKLFELIPPQELTTFLHQQGISGITIGTNYANMKEDSLLKNRCTPVAMAQLLLNLQQRKLLSDSSTNFLLRCMTETQNPADRIKGNLPEGTVLAHKTGTMWSDNDPEIQAFNDVGIITLPDGQPLIIAVFVNHSKLSMEQNAAYIARMSRLVWDYYAR